MRQRAGTRGDVGFQLPATPLTWRDLVAARLAAQARAGIPEADRSPLYSGDVEGYLIPIIMRMGKGDEPSVLAQMRQQGRLARNPAKQQVLQPAAE